MTESSYTISIENAHQTIDKLHQYLSSRKIKVKKSDLKETVSALLGFEASNVLDIKIKKHKEKLQAQSAFDSSGRHKVNSDLVLKRGKNPLQISDFYKKNKSFTTIIDFSEGFEVSGGFKYQQGDVLFATDEYGALKTMLNWEAVAKVQFIYWSDEEREEYGDISDQDLGYWQVNFTGKGDEQHLGEYGESSMDTARYSCDHLNNPDVPIELIEKYFLDEIVQGEHSFYMQNRSGFETCLAEWIDEYYADTFKAESEEEFVSHVERFLPYMGVTEIVEMEVGSSPVCYLKLLSRYGARFDSPELLAKAVSSGDLEVCHFLFEQGNALSNLFQKSGDGRAYFHRTYDWDVSSKSDERLKQFYSTACELGCSLDIADDEGCTPLHMAAKYGKDDLYTFLVSLGASDEIENLSGDTPKMIMSYVHEGREERINRGGVFGELFW